MAPSDTRLFDVRLMIGGLLGLYGIVLVVMGLTASTASLAKADGIRIDLWVGLGMVAVSVAFLTWAFVRPLARELNEADPSDAGETSHPPEA